MGYAVYAKCHRSIAARLNDRQCQMLLTDPDGPRQRDCHNQLHKEYLTTLKVQQFRWNGLAGTWGQIHRHCLKIYPKTCPNIMLGYKLRCHKMILRHVISQFTELILGDLKCFLVETCCHSNYDFCQCTQ